MVVVGHRAQTENLLLDRQRNFSLSVSIFRLKQRSGLRCDHFHLHSTCRLQYSSDYTNSSKVVRWGTKVVANGGAEEGDGEVSSSLLDFNPHASFIIEIFMKEAGTKKLCWYTC